MACVNVGKTEITKLVNKHSCVAVSKQSDS